MQTVQTMENNRYADKMTYRIDILRNCIKRLGINFIYINKMWFNSPLFISKFDI